MVGVWGPARPRDDTSQALAFQGISSRGVLHLHQYLCCIKRAVEYLCCIKELWNTYVVSKELWNTYVVLKELWNTYVVLNKLWNTHCVPTGGGKSP